MENLNNLNYETFYKEVGKKQGWDFSRIKCSKTKSREFDYYEFLSREISQNDTVLDIGCGDSKKVIKFVHAKKIVAIDATPEMIEKSKENYKTQKSTTSHEFLLMNAFGKYSFEDCSFDFVINRHCGCNESEMFRVLKPNGKYIQEDIDETDCLELKYLFGRGQGFPISSRLADKNWKKYQELGFSKIEYFPIREVEFYESEHDLWQLLETTPIIPNFGKGEKDKELFDEYCKTHKTQNGIRLDRELFGFVLTK